MSAFNNKGFTVIELLVITLIISVLTAVVSVNYMKYRRNLQLQNFQIHGEMMAQSFLNCLVYETVEPGRFKSQSCLPVEKTGKSERLQARAVFKKLGLEKQGLTPADVRLKDFKASISDETRRGFCFQFTKKINKEDYTLCFDVDRKTQIIRSIISSHNFCCKNTKDSSCVLPDQLKESVIGDSGGAVISSAYCKSKGFATDFNSYFAAQGFAEKECGLGLCMR